MIKNLSLKFGSSPGSDALNFEATPVTIFVGPNNSGKSKMLQEISRFSREGVKNNNDLILENIEFHGFSEDGATDSINKYRLRPRISETIQPDQIISGEQTTRHQIKE